MPSAASYTNRLRFNAEARNTKIQYPGGVSNTFRANLPAMCTDFNTTITTNDNIPVTKTVYTPPWFMPLDFSKPCRCNTGKSLVCPACKVETTIYGDVGESGDACVVLDGNSGASLDGN